MCSGVIEMHPMPCNILDCTRIRAALLQANHVMCAIARTYPIHRQSLRHRTHNPSTRHMAVAASENMALAAELARAYRVNHVMPCIIFGGAVIRMRSIIHAYEMYHARVQRGRHDATRTDLASTAEPRLHFKLTLRPIRVRISAELTRNWTRARDDVWAPRHMCVIGYAAHTATHKRAHRVYASTLGRCVFARI